VVRRTALLFPGQGSQYPGMGKALAEAFPESRAAFEEADAALSIALSRTCFAGTDAELALTETTQPAILATSVAALRALEVRGVQAHAAAGHSLGEYSAHVAARTVDFRDALRAVRLRGRFMQDAVPVGDGAMAAILGLDPERVARICAEAAGSEIVAPANVNAPGQVVVAGHAGAVERAVELARGAGAKRAVKLQVSAPFHCSLMAPAATRLQPVLEDMVFRDPRFPVYANIDGAAVVEGERARTALVRQVTAPVLWQRVVEAMANDGVETFLEVGPGRVLSGLVKRIRRDLEIISVEDPEGVEAAARVAGGES
jgi:[acyl-carrier-protein] S-malonyltransferase